MFLYPHIFQQRNNNKLKNNTIKTIMTNLIMASTLRMEATFEDNKVRINGIDYSILNYSEFDNGFQLIAEKDGIIYAVTSMKTRDVDGNECEVHIMLPIKTIH